MGCPKPGMYRRHPVTAEPPFSSISVRLAHCPTNYRRLAVYGAGQLFLNISCGLLSVFIGVETDLDKALAVTVLSCHIQNILFLGENCTVYCT